MKLLILLTLISVQAWSNAASQTISLSIRNGSLEKVFKEIRKQTAYNFIYTREDLMAAHPVTLSVKDAPVEQVLDICFKNQPLSYTLEENQVVVKKKTEETPVALTNNKVSLIDIRGRVLNEKGEPVEGINVEVKGTKIITSTDGNGYFLIKDVDENATLLFTGVNVETYEISVKGRTDLSTLYLKTKISKLDEVQIIGYGTSTQRYNVGSVTKITSDEISKQPVSNPLAALQGRVPGLVVTPTSGTPGASFNIQIRGQNSLNPDPNNGIQPLDNPLFIIDGVPFAPQNNNLNQFRSIVSPGINTLLNNPYGGISPFNNINPADIESIEVLRDADATAIYGSRGANGVILITTKKGKTGATKFNMNVYTATNHVTHIMPMMNTQQYLDMRREAYKNDAIIPASNPGNSSTYAPDLLIFDTTRYMNWQKYFIGNSSNSTDLNASISGGSGNTQFLVGAGLHTENFVMPGGFSNDRASVNTNLNHTSNNRKLVLGFSANYSFASNSSSSGGTATPNLLMAYSLPPDYPELLQPDGSIQWTYKGISLGGTGTAGNPYSFLLKKYSLKTNNLISNLQLSYNLLPGLWLRSSFGYNFLYGEEYASNPAVSQDPSRLVTASADFGKTHIDSWIVEPQIEYSKVVAKSRIDFLLGGTFQQNINSTTTINASGYSNDALIKSVSGAPNKTVSDNYSQYKYNAIFGRLNYIISKKYIGNLTGRRDGSSRFGPGKQFGNFGSLGLGWLFSEEPFIKSYVPFISYGKLHSSYGTTGNDKIGDYQFISRWASTLYPYQGTLGYSSQNLFNENFSWAVTKKLEAGMEVGLLNNRLLLTATWFRDRSGNQLVQYPLPTQTGFTTVIENLHALVENQGWEFQFTSANIKRKDFDWNTSFNITIPKNKLVSFPGIENSSYAGRYIVGQSLFTITGFQYIGVDDTTGIFQFRAADGHATTNPNSHNGNKLNDEKIIGSPDPKFYGGLLNSFSYKGMELELFVEFKRQMGINYLGQLYSSVIPGQQNNLPTSFLSRWQKPGDQSGVQRLTTLGSSPAALAARFYFIHSGGVYSDASYIRFKTVSLSYNLAGKYLNKLRMQGCRIYLTAQNIFTITGYRGNDPETQSFYSLPPLRTMAAGIQFNF